MRLLIAVTITLISQGVVVSTNTGAAQPRLHDAESILRICRFRASDSGIRDFDDDEFRIYRDTQVALVQSRFVLAAAMRQPGISALSMLSGQLDPVNLLRQRLVVEVVGDSEVVTVRMTGEDPDQLVRLVDAIVEAYMREIVDAERSEIRLHIDAVKSKIQQSGGGAGDTSRNAVIDPFFLASLQRRLVSLELALTAPPRVQLLQKATPQAQQ